MVACVHNPKVGKAEPGGFLGLAGHGLAPLVSSNLMRLSQKQDGWFLRNNTQGFLLASTGIHTHLYMYLHTRAHVPSCKKTPKHIEKRQQKLVFARPLAKLINKRAPRLATSFTE